MEDSGPGIPAGERDRLFDRFHRVTGHGATEQGGGAGLGLAIADSIVRSTGGHWRISESALGGALFEVSWRRPHGAGSPAVPSRPHPPPRPDPPPAGLAGPPRAHPPARDSSAR